MSGVRARYYAVYDFLPTDTKVAVIEHRGKRQAQFMSFFTEVDTDQEGAIRSAEVRKVQMRVTNANRTYEFLVVFVNNFLAPQNQCIKRIRPGQNWLGPVLMIKLARRGLEGPTDTRTDENAVLNFAFEK